MERRLRRAAMLVIGTLLLLPLPAAPATATTASEPGGAGLAPLGSDLLPLLLETVLVLVAVLTLARPRQPQPEPEPARRTAVRARTPRDGSAY